MIINILIQFYLLMVCATINSASTFSCDNTDTCLLSGSVVMCTCAVEDESGSSFTLWSGSAFTLQCSGSFDRIVLLHIQYGFRQPRACGERISAVPINQESTNYISNATITVSTSNNGSSIGCSMGGLPPVGMIVLNVGEIPPAPSNPTIPMESLTRGRFSLIWTESANVFGGVGSYQVMVRSDRQGDATIVCGHMTAPNGEASPLREFTDWATDGQMCYFSVTTVTGDNCNFTSTPSQEVAITLQGPHQAIVEKVILDNPVYVDNHLQIVDISFMYTQASPIVIIDGVTSVTTHFNINYSNSGNESCTMVIPLSCDQQQWCNYTLTLDNCPTMTEFGNGMFSIVPLNIIGSGIIRNSDLIANRNPLFTVTDLNSSSKSFQLKFQATFTVAGCFFQYGLVSSMECTNFTLNATVASANSAVIVINVTLPQSGRYCYRVNCTVAPNPMHFAPIAQGMFEYQSTTVPTAASGDTFPLWVIAVIIIIAVIFAVIIVIITLAIVWKIKSKGNCENCDRRGEKEESVANMPEYEEVTTQPTTSSEAFEMGENVAYGPWPVLKNRAS